jgi:hypothetical protein
MINCCRSGDPSVPKPADTVTTTASRCTPNRSVMLGLSPSCSFCRPKCAEYVITVDVVFVIVQSVAQHLTRVASAKPAETVRPREPIHKC